MNLVIAYFCAVSIACGSYFVTRLSITSILLTICFFIKKLWLVKFILNYVSVILTLTLTSSILIISVQIFDIIGHEIVFYNFPSFFCYFLILIYLFLLEGLVRYRTNRFHFVKKLDSEEQERRSLLIN